MSSFYVIDHSLRHSGDHHFDLVWSLATAIQSRGLQVVVGTNTKLKESLPITPQPHALPSAEPCTQQFSRQLNISPESVFLHSKSNFSVSPDSNITIRRVFRDTMYQPISQLAGLQKMERTAYAAEKASQSRLSQIWSRASESWRNVRRQRQTERFVKRFAQDCQHFFRPFQFVEGDHVCLATVSELELAGLARFLKRFPDSIHAQWHLWFHFPLLAGRPPEYQRQSKQLERVREFFISQLRHVPCHRIHFYCTTDLLAEQYNRMGLVKFRGLPYPVSPRLWQTPFAAERPPSSWDKGAEPSLAELPPLSEFHESPAHDDFANAVLASLRTQSGVAPTSWDQPLRLSSLGAVRREKQQQHYLQPLINQLWSPWLSTGKLRLQFQQPRKRWYSPAKLRFQPPSDSRPADLDDAVKTWPHPLPAEGYRDLLDQTDCGLLLYEGATYFARRAGIFGELVSVGKPVIVSAGSWLHEQLKDVQFAYHQYLLTELSSCRTLYLEQLDWNSQNIPLPGGVVTFGQHLHPFELSIPLEPHERGVLLRFLWHCPTTPGIYCQIQPEVEIPKAKPTSQSGGERCDDSQSRVASLSVEIPAATKRNDGPASMSNRGGTAVLPIPRPTMKPAESASASLGRTAMLAQVVGHRSGGGESSLFIPVPEHSGQVTLRLTNAFHDSTASITGLNVHTLASDCLDRPLGVVGVSVANYDQLAAAVSEWMRHHEHYRKTAEAFGQRWRQHNHPEAVIAAMLKVAQQLARAA